jgi:outer membrane protein OmpA-like peptidoglycan-associated protein
MATTTASSIAPTAAPDRAEDHDGFEDKDGCPDIDNDLDQVLDIADKCTAVAETYNGYDDDDGCPDAIPTALDGAIGTIEGLLYREGDTEVRAIAKDGLDKLALLLVQHPTVRLVLVGHTDDREAIAAPDGEPAPDGEALDGEAPDGEALALALGRARADARARGVDRARHRGRAPGRRQRRRQRAGVGQRHAARPAAQPPGRGAALHPQASAVSRGRVGRAALLALLASAAPARGNGRFPASSSLDFQPGRPDHIAVGVTFGLLVSRDGGATWRWDCEAAIGFEGTYDPIYLWSPSGALFASTFNGLKVARDPCGWQAVPGPVGAADVTALAIGGDGAIWAAVSDLASGTALYRSDDDGRRFTASALPGQVGDVWHSIAVAPDDPRRIYVTGRRMMAGQRRPALLYRSTDGGASWVELPTDALVGAATSELFLPRSIRARPTTSTRSSPTSAPGCAPRCTEPPTRGRRSRRDRPGPGSSRSRPASPGSWSGPPAWSWRSRRRWACTGRPMAAPASRWSPG